MESHEVAAHVRERLGMDVQAASLMRARARGVPMPRVWAVMTEHGYFWLVEDDGLVELFRAVSARGVTAAVGGCATAAEAGRRFLELHPVKHEPERRAESEAEAPSPPVGGDLSFACQACGTWVTRRRRTEGGVRELCKRCRHAERERLRYHDDPQYRARRLAYSAARYRQQGPEGGTGDRAIHRGDVPSVTTAS